MRRRIGEGQKIRSGNLCWRRSQLHSHERTVAWTRLLSQETCCWVGNGDREEGTGLARTWDVRDLWRGSVGFIMEVLGCQGLYLGVRESF